MKIIMVIKLGIMHISQLAVSHFESSWLHNVPLKFEGFMVLERFSSLIMVEAPLSLLAAALLYHIADQCFGALSLQWDGGGSVCVADFYPSAVSYSAGKQQQ